MATEQTINRTAAPAQSPVTVQKAKQKLRLYQGSSEHDDELKRLIDAATEQFEQDTDRAVILQEFTVYRDSFPNTSVALDVKPAQSIVAITYLDSDGNTQTLDPADYVFDAARREVIPVKGKTWPGTNEQRNNIAIAYSAGYGDPANVPDVIVETILVLVAALFYGNAPDAQAYQQAYERLLQNKFRTSYP